MLAGIQLPAGRPVAPDPALRSDGLTAPLEPVDGAADAEHFALEPPEDTRAWTRAMLLRALPAARLRRVDWDSLEVEAEDPRGPPIRIGPARPARSTPAPPPDLDPPKGLALLGVVRNERGAVRLGLVGPANPAEALGWHTRAYGTFLALARG